MFRPVYRPEQYAPPVTRQSIDRTRAELADIAANEGHSSAGRPQPIAYDPKSKPKPVSFESPLHPGEKLTLSYSFAESAKGQVDGRMSLRDSNGQNVKFSSVEVSLLEQQMQRLMYQK